jgi:hypothetical protein
MEREQLTATLAARGRGLGSTRSTNRMTSAARKAIAAKGMGRSTQAKTIESILGASPRRSITALKPGAKPRG